MKNFLFYFLMLFSIFCFGQEYNDMIPPPHPGDTECHKDKLKDPLDPFNYIETQVVEVEGVGTLLLFYMIVPDNMRLDVQCISYNEYHEVVEQRFSNVRELVFSQMPEVLIKMYTGGSELTKAVGYINWEIPDEDAERISMNRGATVWTPNKFPIQFKLTYATNKY